MGSTASFNLWFLATLLRLPSPNLSDAVAHQVFIRAILPSCAGRRPWKLS